MALEIEHKYKVTSTTYRDLAFAKREIMQGYLSRSNNSVIRIRIADDKAFLTVKSKNINATRLEFEYPVPTDDARIMMPLCGKAVISKTRYLVKADDGHIWEIDEFHGRNEGLTVAEIELSAPDETYTLPDFIGENVTGNPAYFNSNLCG